ncbi:MAG: IPTL-CTERM sorting domain-containing protein [Phycisphaerae bacterium]|nr:IPTL-CTERM sorting domain-containing protein [Phycisphaerae bacterium]
MPDECEESIPTVSEWGLIVMTLLLLTAGTVVFGRQRRPAAA